jgi:cytoskeleton-associated protein 5
LPSVIPDLDNALKSKNPQVKEGTLKFLSRCLSSSKTPIQPNQVKPLSETLAVLLEDSFEGCRNESASCLGILMKMVGERPLNALMDGLADVRKTKVKEAYDKATVRSKPSAAKPKPEPSKAPPAQKAKPGASKAPPAAIKSAVVEEPPDMPEPPKKPVPKPPVLSSVIQSKNSSFPNHSRFASQRNPLHPLL